MIIRGERLLFVGLIFSFLTMEDGIVLGWGGDLSVQILPVCSDILFCRTYAQCSSSVEWSVGAHPFFKSGR